MKFGRGSVWELRWFAKPLVTGSIPATASISEGNMRQALYRAGRAFGKWLWLHGHKLQKPFFSGVWQEMYNRGSFVSNYISEEKKPLVVQVRDQSYEIHKLKVALADAKQKSIALSKELSAAKRRKPPND
jgi:hypothetical protein